MKPATHILSDEVLYHLRQINATQGEIADLSGVSRQRINQLQMRSRSIYHNHLAVVGGQFGSEGKGRIVEYLLRVSPNWTAAVRTGGPQAGHTVDDLRTDQPTTYAFRQLPVSIAQANAPQLDHFIGRNAIVDLEVLAQEMQDWGGSAPIYLDRNATVLESHHKELEHLPDGNGATLVERIGSTGKGIGATRADRIWRRARLVEDLAWGDLPAGLVVVDTHAMLKRHWYGGQILFEGAQGLGLSLNSRYYPTVTSSDSTTTQMLADAGITTRMIRDRLVYTLGVYRTHPIRVAGQSGPLFRETTWEELGLEPEITTVTKKIRRVGHWDLELASYTVEFGGVDFLAITFLDYLPEDEREGFLSEVESKLDRPVLLASQGPGKISEVGK